MIKKFAIIAPALLTLSAMTATPAAAAAGNNSDALRAEIAQLDRQIDRAHGLSERKERQLESTVSRLQEQYRSFARGGFNRGEIASLNRGIESLRAELADATGGSRHHDRHDQRDHDRGSRH